MNEETGLNTLGFIESNSLSYTEIQRDLTNFVNALSEDEKLGFKTLFEGTTSQILIEMLAAKSSDEIYHIITSRSENLLYYLNRKDSAIAISQNNAYSAFRGSNVKLSITMTPNSSITLSKMSSIGTAEDYDLIIIDDLELVKNKSVTFDVYLGTVKEQTVIADTEDYLIFRFTNSNISEQIALYLDGKEVPFTKNILEMLDDKYFCITNAYSGVDAIYLNKRLDFTHHYTNNSKLTLKYIEFIETQLSSIDIISQYGTITNVTQLSTSLEPESVSSIKANAQLYAETQNRIVARDDFHKVFQENNPEIKDAVGHDYSNAQVEVTYVKKNGELLTKAEYQSAYNNLYRRRAYGIPMCLLSHPDIMLNLDVNVILQLNSNASSIIETYVRQALAKYELQLGSTIDFAAIENELEDYKFIKIARVTPKYTEFTTNTFVPTGTTFRPSTPNGKLYVVKNALFLTGMSAPSWSTTIGSTTIDNDIIWIAEEKSYSPQPLWEANKSIRIQNIVWPSNVSNVQFRCIGYACKTGLSEPSWPTVKGQMIEDNQILWISVEKDATATTWTNSTIVEKGSIVNASYSTPVSYQAIEYMPKTSSIEPDWQTNENTFTYKNVQYAVINEEPDILNLSKSNIQLNWNQYVKFNETIQVI